MCSHHNEFPREFGKRVEKSSNIFSVLARVRIQAPHVFAQKLIPQEHFPTCISIVPGNIAKPNFDLLNY